jgi:hypothetical protein
MLARITRTGTLLGLLLCSWTMSAQESNQPPKPAIGMGTGSALVQTDSPADVPDTRPLSGAQDLSLGTQSGSHNFVLPSFGITTQMETNPYRSTQGNQSGLISTTYLTARMGVNKISDRSELLFDYLAAGGFSNDANQTSAVIQSLNFAETVTRGRWSQMFGDEFTYTPESSFGFSGIGLNNLGVGLGDGVGSSPGFSQSLQPDQSILTKGSRRISNSAISQTTYALGYRSSLTFLGSYATLHFADSALQNSTEAAGRIGYNYLLSPLNSMAVSYGYNRLTFSGLVLNIQEHVVQLSFARRVTGHLSFQVGAGPDVQIFQATIPGAGTVVSWAGSSALKYQQGHIRVGLDYDHLLGNGGGVLPGAKSDLVSAELGRTFRAWDATLWIGYASNRGLSQTTLNAGAIAPQRWFATARASRHFVRYGSLFIGYSANGQSSLMSICALPACAANSLIHTVSVGYNWGLRPIILQ